MRVMVPSDHDAPARWGPPVHIVVGLAAFLVLLANWLREFFTRHPSGIAVAVTVAGVAAFVAAFFRLVWADAPGLVAKPPTRPIVAMAGLAVVLGIVDPAPDALLVITVGAMSAAYLPGRGAISGITLAALGVIAVHVGHGSSAADTARDAIQSLAIGFFVLGYARLAETNRALELAREQVAGLAVANERLRFARDLHDLLGHTLTVIRVKSELARRLVHRDPHRAATEMDEVERVARDALGEVRDAVGGYRRPRLADELQGVKDALTSVGIDAQVVGSTGDLPDDVEVALAWTIREAATNVIRHSQARTCRVEVSTDGGHTELDVTDDGVGPARDGGASGGGLRGIRERIGAIGGSVEFGPAPGAGSRLRVSVPAGPR
ncbi:MAG: Two component signal transduction histidine kinase [Acidimicrobiales bacterium]|jgi:two-component system sensor histidine kinase DesK|nr:Two component signal transduction histidine kinase [Acidimicrobiales bacterium]